MVGRMKYLLIGIKNLFVLIGSQSKWLSCKGKGKGKGKGIVRY